MKVKFIPKKKLGNGKLWLYQLEKEPYFPYGKGAQIEKVNKLLLILIVTYRTVISAVTAAWMWLTLMALMFQSSLTDLEARTWHYLSLLFLLFAKRIRFGRMHQTWQRHIDFFFFFPCKVVHWKKRFSVFILFFFKPENLI